MNQFLSEISGDLKQEHHIELIPFANFLQEIAKNPKHIFRNINQMVHDMINHYIPQGINEYPNDPESINFIKYNTNKLFVEGLETPFFADRLLANQLIQVIRSLRQGVMKNKMLVFVGPPGSGKSTFLNNFIEKLEHYSRTEKGVMFDTAWKINIQKLGVNWKNLLDENPESPIIPKDKNLYMVCPGHDHPIIHIPKSARKNLLSSIIEDKDVLDEIYNKKEFSWVLESESCPICSSLIRQLLKSISPKEVWSMLYARHYEFARKLGEGISVYNSGDPVNHTPKGNRELQRRLELLFHSSNAVRYQFSDIALTNNGVMAIMDVKSHNIERLENLHGVISDGIHKVGNMEEKINSLFVTLINPEDLSVIINHKSFRDRVSIIQIPYVRDYKTEADIYKNGYGHNVEDKFLPNILESFAKVVVSSRLSKNSKEIIQWIKDPKKYQHLCDDHLKILRMELYSGNLPQWLHAKDLSALDKESRRAIIGEGESQGQSGLSGRESLRIFDSFYRQYRVQQNYITIDNVITFFRDSVFKSSVTSNFLDSLKNYYDYNLLQEIKEAMYYYNDTQISKEIMNYLFAVNVEMDSVVECPYTKEKIKVNLDFLIHIEKQLIPEKISAYERMTYRKETQMIYITQTLNEIRSGKKIQDTKQFMALLADYNISIKQFVLEPFANNKNFRRAIQDYETPNFKSYDKRLTEEVNYLIQNLVEKYNYSLEGAKQVTIYCLDEELMKKFPNN